MRMAFRQVNMCIKHPRKQTARTFFPLVHMMTLGVTCIRHHFTPACSEFKAVDDLSMISLRHQWLESARVEGINLLVLLIENGTKCWLLADQNVFRIMCLETTKFQWEFDYILRLCMKLAQLACLIPHWLKLANPPILWIFVLFWFTSILSEEVEWCLVMEVGRVKG